MNEASNIFINTEGHFSDEIFEEILNHKNFKIERIISSGQTSPDGFWYDQDQNEWVILMQGEAVISFKNESKKRLIAGDYILIPAHKKHRVEYTSTEKKTIWLAIHFID